MDLGCRFLCLSKKNQGKKRILILHFAPCLSAFSSDAEWKLGLKIKEDSYTHVHPCPAAVVSSAICSMAVWGNFWCSIVMLCHDWYSSLCVYFLSRCLEPKHSERAGRMRTLSTQKMPYCPSAYRTDGPDKCTFWLGHRGFDCPLSLDDSC